MSLLEIEDLRLAFEGFEGIAEVIDGVSLAIAAGEAVGLVGESGCGKSVLARSVLRLDPSPPLRVRSGAIRFDNADVLAMAPAALRTLRGAAIGMVFQDPTTYLNPVFTIGQLLADILRAHPSADREGIGPIGARSVALLRAVQLPEPEAMLARYPHQLSGGMRQRVLIAMALAGAPRLLIADEPTTALDVTIQAQILALLADLIARLDLTLLLITHDVGVVGAICRRVAVMYAGAIVEEAPTVRLFEAPRHPYTRGLLDAVPDLAHPGRLPRGIPGTIPSLRDPPPGCRFHPRCPIAMAVCRHEKPVLRAVGPGHRVAACSLRGHSNRPKRADRNLGPLRPSTPLGPAAPDPLLATDDLVCAFGRLRAVGGVSLALAPGEALGLVGESGCGKSTLLRALLRLTPAQSGRIALDGTDITRTPRAALGPLRRAVQVVFQNPDAALDPRASVFASVAEPLRIQQRLSASALRDRVAELLADVGLPGEFLWRHPHELSGGQKQRVAIARALAPAPRALLLDEPTSALDVSVQAQIIELLAELRARHGLAMLFVSHNLAVVRLLCERVAVMQHGRVVEQGAADAVLAHPAHPYTQALLASVLPVHASGHFATRPR